MNEKFYIKKIMFDWLDLKKIVRLTLPPELLKKVMELSSHKKMFIILLTRYMRAKNWKVRI